jgi:alpha-L-rhamnosidase
MLGWVAAGVAGTAPSNLRVEDRAGRVVTDEPKPRLAWEPAGEVAEGGPVAKWELQARVGGGTAVGAEWNPAPWPVEEGPWRVWDGPVLGSRAQVEWRVRGMAADGTAGEWSGMARFEMGLREPGDWDKAQWIAMDAAKRERSAPMLRKTFVVPKPVLRARLYVCGLGYHEALLNGERLGDAVLEPGQTDYDRRCFYVVHDVTRELKQGSNALGVWLGDGFFNQDKVWGQNGLSYGQPRLIARLEILHDDDTSTIVVSDGSWKCAKGAVVSSNVYQGEEYDARLESDGWARVDFADEKWEPVVVTDSPGGVLMAQELPPCVRAATVPVVAVTEPAPGVKVHDFGRNFTGWEKLRIKAPAGTRVTMTFAETLAPDGGRIDTLSTGVPATGVEQRDTYVCRGGREEIWEPRFTWHGFRYAELTVEGGLPEKLELEGVAVHTGMPVTGTFECSDPLINRILEAAHWTQVSNVISLPMDCPARERCGWTGDAHLCVPFTMHRYDAAAMWRKYMNDILTMSDRESNTIRYGKNFIERHPAVKPRGIPHMIAPGRRKSGMASPDWGSAIVFIPWDLYQFTGDRRWIERHAATMAQWTDHVATFRDPDKTVRVGLGDWCKPWPRAGERPNSVDHNGAVVPMLSTACLYRCADIMARVEEMLGDDAEAKRFRALARETKEAFAKAFRDPNTGGFGDQTVNSIAVQWGLADGPQAKQAAQALADQVAAEDHHFMTGVFGMPSLWPTLADFGHEETAWKALQTETAPGFKYLFQCGATSLWETWPTPEDQGQRWKKSMSHPFQGAMSHWFYSGLAGIRPTAEGAGFRVFRLQPVMTPHLTYVKCRERGAMGWIASEWRRDGDRVTWDVEVPPGAQAEVTVPGKPIEATGCLKEILTGKTRAGSGRGRVVFEWKR